MLFVSFVVKTLCHLVAAPPRIRYASTMRICSLLPGATEIAFALGLGDQIVGVTHECDHPADAQNQTDRGQKRDRRQTHERREIDRKVAELLQAGKGLYFIDEAAFADAAPDVILTQGLCEVCALDYDEVVKAAGKLSRPPAIVSLNPHSMQEILDDIRRVGAATGRNSAAMALVDDLRQRIEQVGAANRTAARGWFVWSGSSRSTAPVTGCRRWSPSPAVMMSSAVPVSLRRKSTGARLSTHSRM